MSFTPAATLITSDVNFALKAAGKISVSNYGVSFFNALDPLYFPNKEYPAISRSIPQSVTLFIDAYFTYLLNFQRPKSEATAETNCSPALNGPRPAMNSWERISVPKKYLIIHARV